MAVNSSKTLRNLVIYQIFTRNYKEGTFRAVEADLDRIKALGTDFVYLLPVQPSGKVHRKGSMGSPYAISDYRGIDPVQGTMEDFIHLTEQIHAAGMKVMIDVVYNHTSPDSWLAANHPEWFYHKKDGSFGNRIGDWWDVIDLDYANRDLWDYQIDTLKMWAQYVDGFRCDVAPLVPLEFWIRARAEVATVRPDCVWLAESIEPGFLDYCRRSGIPAASDGELYQAYDILYEYDVFQYLIGFLNGSNSLQDYLEHINQQEVLYPDNFSKLRYLENHDRSRAAALFPDEAALRNMTAWIYFMNGTTMIYAGQEFCAESHPTLFDLDTIPFDTGYDISDLLTKLAEIKKDKVFAEGYFHAKAIGRNADVILAEREIHGREGQEARKCIGIFSTTGQPQMLMIDVPDGQYTDLISGKTIDVFERIFRYDGEPVMFFAE